MRISVFSVTILILMILSITPDFASAQQIDDYTILVYMVGSDLESGGEEGIEAGGAATQDIIEMIDGSIADNINLILLTGGANTEDFSTVKFRQVTQEGLFDLQDWGTINMGEAITLEDFLIAGVTNFPAENYAIIIWDHGGGVNSGVGFDELHGFDSLTVDELVTAFSNAKDQTGVQFELVGFDACLMATAEVAYSIKDFSNYMVASEEIEPGHGWDYSTIVQTLNDQPSIDGANLGIAIVDSYNSHAKQAGTQESVTLSVIDLEQIDTVASNLDSLAGEISEFDAEGNQLLSISSARIYAEEYGKDLANNNYADLIDLTDFLLLLAYEKPELESQIYKVINSIDDAVVYSMSGVAKPYATGLSIYLPFNGLYDEYYESVDFSDSWKGFVYNYVQSWDQDSLAPSFGNEGLSGNELQAELLSIDVISNYVSISRLDQESGREQILGIFPIGLDENGNSDFEWDSSWFVLCNEQDCSEASFYIDWISDTQLSISMPGQVNGQYANLLYLFDVESANIEFLGYWPGIEESELAQKEILTLQVGDVVNTLMQEYDPEINDFIYTTDDVDILVDEEFGLYYMMLPQGEYYSTFLALDAAGNWGISDSILVESSSQSTAYTSAEYEISEEPVGLQEGSSDNGQEELLPDTGEIEGTYIDEQAGFEIDLPVGWKGINFLGIVMAAPGGIDLATEESPGTVIMIIALDRGTLEESSFNADLSSSFATGEPVDDSCDASASYLIVNGANALNAVQECSSDGMYSKSNVYGFMSNSSLAIVAFVTSSEQEYENNIASFEQSINTLRLANAVDFRQGLSQTLNLQTSVYEVETQDTIVELEIGSNSNITDFSFSEENKQVTFNVEGQDGTMGATSIAIDRLLTGPYTVTVDGSVMQDYSVINDTTTGETILMLSYSHSVHEVAITGTQVVPEFPITVLVLILSLSAVVAVTKKYNLLKG